MKNIFISLLIVFFSCGSPSISADYKVISSEESGEDLVIKIRLSKTISHEELESLATYLINCESDHFKTYMYYFLPDNSPDNLSLAWATTHWTPGLNIVIPSRSYLNESPRLLELPEGATYRSDMPSTDRMNYHVTLQKKITYEEMIKAASYFKTKWDVYDTISVFFYLKEEKKDNWINLVNFNPDMSLEANPNL